MKIALVPGHTLRGKGTGAAGYINESQENRIVSELVKKWLEYGGATVYYGKVDEANDYLQRQVAIANKQSVDLAVQIHFNASMHTYYPMGTETLYVSNGGKEYAAQVNDKLNDIFKNRGVKYRDNLYWLNSTNAPAILIEVCFVDSKADTDIYKRDKEAVAKKIAEGILGKTIEEPKSDFVVRITADTLNVRSGPGTEYPATAQVKEGQAFTITEQKGDWGRLKSGAGWIHLGYTEKV